MPLSFRRPHAVNQLDRRFHLLHGEVFPSEQPPEFATGFQISAARECALLGQEFRRSSGDQIARE